MNPYPAWKKRDVQRKWRNFIAVFLTIILILAIFNGIVKTADFGRYLGKGRWDSRSSFAAALATFPPSVFIYQKESGSLSFLKVDPDIYFETGEPDKPLVKISTVVKENNGLELSRVLSLSFRANIENFVTFKNEKEMNAQAAEELFKNFASLTTPFVILTKGLEGEIKDTNITRLDLLKLWWQLKGLSIEKLSIADMAPYGEEIITADNQKVLGADTESLNRQIRRYLENLEVRNEHFKVYIQNASGVSGAGRLAADFASTIGAEVVKIEAADLTIEKTVLLTNDKSAYSAFYLVTLFNCDNIGDLQDEGGMQQIVIKVGRDFAARYFK